MNPPPMTTTTNNTNTNTTTTNINSIPSSSISSRSNIVSSSDTDCEQFSTNPSKRSRNGSSSLNSSGSNNGNGNGNNGMRKNSSSSSTGSSLQKGDSHTHTHNLSSLSSPSSRQSDSIRNKNHSNSNTTAGAGTTIVGAITSSSFNNNNTTTTKSSSTSDKQSKSSSNDETLTEEEKVQANRLRNREHARNTRARKKAYLESLKSTLDELCRERDTLVNERASAASLLLEMQKTRTDVLLSFFALRSSYEKKRVIWSSILDESMSCVMPVTPYRSFPASEVQISKCQRNVMGIDGMISDAASLHVLLNSLVDRSKYPNEVVQFRYTLIAEEAVVSGNQMMARWSMSTTNAVSLGAKREIGKTGMLCARFNSAHKIVALELMFDVMAFMLQLKQSAGAKSFTMVPNTVQTCIGPFENTPMVMTLAERPYTITKVNTAWEEMTLYKADDVVGKMSSRILQGEKTERQALESLMSHVLYRRPASAVITNYDRRGRMFRNFINVYPLSTDSKITHYVGLTVHHEQLETDESLQVNSNSNDSDNSNSNNNNNNSNLKSTINAEKSDNTGTVDENSSNKSGSSTTTTTPKPTEPKKDE